MKRITILAAGAGLLALAACHRDNEAANDAALTNDMAMNEMNMANETNNMAMAPASGQDFVDQVAASDMYEIEAGKLAEDKGSDAAVKNFGKMLVTDHTKSSAELKAAAAKAEPPVTPPTSLPPDKQAMLDDIKAASGADFDKMFIDQQIDAHTKALDLLNSYAAGGSSEPLKAFATTAGPVVQSHLDKAKSLQK
jgi:putative membrane protein